MIKHASRWIEGPRASWLVALGLSVLFLALDYVTGPQILVPIFYVLPVGLMAWQKGKWPALGLAGALVGARFMFSFSWAVAEIFPLRLGLINAGLRAGLLMIVALLVAGYRKANARIEALEGILPICAFCKKIRNQGGTWEPIERYVTERSGATFSHGFCEECGRKHYGDYASSRGPAARS